MEMKTEDQPQASTIQYELDTAYQFSPTNITES